MPAQMLSDFEIISAIKTKLIQISGLDPEYVENKIYDKNSPIQPSSLDLRIGKIFVPPVQTNINLDIVDDLNRIRGYSIPPGNTVVVETLERITLMSTISAFGFPPDSLSSNAILMTNPGHVDPGYSGHLKFTLINMGRDNFQINYGDLIVSLLIFQFDRSVHKDYGARREYVFAQPNYKKMLNILSHDFGNLTQRLDDAAQNAVSDRTRSLDIAKLWVPALSGAIATALTVGALWMFSNIPPLSHIATKYDLVTAIEDKNKILSNRISALEKGAPIITDTD